MLALGPLVVLPEAAARGATRAAARGLVRRSVVGDLLVDVLHLGSVRRGVAAAAALALY